MSKKGGKKNQKSEFIKGNFLCAVEKVKSNSEEETRKKLQENFSNYPVTKFEFLSGKIIVFFNEDYQIPSSLIGKDQPKDFSLSKLTDVSQIWETIILTTSLRLDDIKTKLAQKAPFILCKYRVGKDYSVIAKPSSLLCYVDSFLKGEFPEVTNIIPFSLVNSFMYAPTFIIEGKEHFVNDRLVQQYSTIKNNQQIIHIPHWSISNNFFNKIYKNNEKNVKTMLASCSDQSYINRFFYIIQRKSKLKLNNDTFQKTVIPVSDFSKQQIIWYSAWDRHIISSILEEQHICGDLLEFFVEFSQDHKSLLGQTLNPLKEMCDVIDSDLYEITKESLTESDKYEDTCRDIFEMIINPEQ